MRETSPATATTAEEQQLARDLFARARDDHDHRFAESEIAASLAAARRAGYAAGLEERADDAHTSGHREGVEAAVAVFSSLFSGEPDTPCRTTWRREAGWSLPGAEVPLTECVEVPLDELRSTFDEAERLAEGAA